MVVQTVGSPPIMQERQVRFLGWEYPLEDGMATHSSILAWRIPWTEDLVGCSPRGHKESDRTEATKHDSMPWVPADVLGW